MVKISINFGGDLNNVNVSTLADVFKPEVAGLLGFEPSRVEALVNGTLVTDMSFEFDDGDVVTIRTKANSKASTVKVSVNFGGDVNTVNISTVADLFAPGVAGLFGFEPSKVEALVNGTLVTDTSFQLDEGDEITIRTKANSKAARTIKAKASPAKKASKASKAQATAKANKKSC